MLFSLLSSLVVCAVGFLYPAYSSFKALELEAGSPEAAEKQTQWLVYWVVFGLISVASSFLDTFFFWVPFYDIVKILLCIYLVLPQTQGALVLFHIFFRPKLLQYEPVIDEALEEAQRRAGRASREVGQRGWQAIRQLVQEALSGESTMEDAGDRITELDEHGGEATPVPAPAPTPPTGPAALLSTQFYSELAFQGLRALAARANHAAATASSSLSPLRGTEGAASAPEKVEALRRRREALGRAMREVEDEEKRVAAASASTGGLTPTGTTSAVAPSPTPSHRSISGQSGDGEGGVITEDEFSFVERIASAEGQAKGQTKGRTESGSWLPWSGSVAKTDSATDPSSKGKAD